jgi:hypothetical protein
VRDVEVQAHTDKPPIAAITLSALSIVWVSWVVLAYMGRAPERQEQAFAGLQMVSALVTTGALILLSFWKVPTTRSSLFKLWLATAGLVGSAAMGIFVVPLLAVRYWFGFIDFEKYGPRSEGAWIFLTMAAVVFCMLRVLRSK